MAKFSHAILSEPKTGYVSRKAGAEHCANCEHFVEAESGCNGPKMKELSERPRLNDGNVKVSPTAWCKFWEEE
jgi:hypothetical protein